MTMNEIGSEFWLQDIPMGDETFALSGRTAIDLLIQDIMANGLPVQSVYMPAWCCDSMLLPFVDRGINVMFYDVCIEEQGLSYQINDATEVDILYVTNYFGYDSTLGIEHIKKFKQRGCTVVYDRTHSLFRDEEGYVALADYTIASLRKWLGVPCGAVLSKKNGLLSLPDLENCPYLNDKIEAMTLKAAYMEQPKENLKPLFLTLYGKFGHQLTADYRNYKMDRMSQSIWRYADRQAIKEKRCANAAQLQEWLKEIPQISQLFEYENGDCPLFVPVLLGSSEERDALRKHLTAHAIYCPVHWPKPEQIASDMEANTLYERELSLLCDQRYDFDDMQHIIATIKEFYK